jgi:hypothetical protein
MTSNPVGPARREAHTFDATDVTCTPRSPRGFCSDDGGGGTCDCPAGQECKASNNVCATVEGNVTPENCSEAHGSVGCCGPDGDLWHMEGGRLPNTASALSPCGWNAWGAATTAGRPPRRPALSAPTRPARSR